MILWMKTPKTGGTSILRQFTALGLIPSKMECLLPDRRNDFKHPSRPEYERPYRFTVVRNPFDKIVSAWRYLLLTRHRTLVDVLQNLPVKSAHPTAWLHLTAAQVHLVADENGFVEYDRIIRFEDLQAGIDAVMEENGLDPVHLIHFNRTDREPGYRQYYTRQTRRLVERKYWADLELFGYEF